VPYDIALLLKQKGFDKPLVAYYNIYNKQIFFTDIKIQNEAIFCPTLKEATTWIKEKYDFDVEPKYESIVEFLNKI